MPDKQTETVRINLKPQVRTAIESRIAKYLNPRNLEWEWDDAQKWERHAMNAVLDLKAAEAALTQQKAELERTERELERYKRIYKQTPSLSMMEKADRAEAAEARLTQVTTERDAQYNETVNQINRVGVAEVRLHTVMEKVKELPNKFSKSFYNRSDHSYSGLQIHTWIRNEVAALLKEE